MTTPFTPCRSSSRRSSSNSNSAMLRSWSFSASTLLSVSSGVGSQERQQQQQQHQHPAFIADNLLEHLTQGVMQCHDVAAVDSGYPSPFDAPQQQQQLRPEREARDDEQDQQNNNSSLSSSLEDVEIEYEDPCLRQDYQLYRV